MKFFILYFLTILTTLFASQSDLQTRVEDLLLSTKQEVGAKELQAIILNSSSGEIISFASSEIKIKFPEELEQLVPYVHSYEPGFAISPIFFAAILEKDPNILYETLDGHNGSYEINGMKITDNLAFNDIGVLNILHFSSNIGMAQLAQRLEPIEYYMSLKNFGFTHIFKTASFQDTTKALPKMTEWQSSKKKIITSYGYMIETSLLQLAAANNVFNNNGIYREPKLQDANESYCFEVIKSQTAQKMKEIFTNSVKNGFGTMLQMDGKEIGALASEAYMFNGEKYSNNYTHTIIGFVNDGDEKYTIAIVAFDPKQNTLYPYLTVGNVFKKIAKFL